MRLDKMLGNLGYGTRSEIKKFCKQGLVTVNDEIVKKADTHIDENSDCVCFNGDRVEYRKYIYLMMNKPYGYLSATFDRYDPTVIELIDEKYHAFEPFPVGRLDKDTEGLLILTNDGHLSHRVLSPKNHVPKKYFAIIDKMIDEYDIEKFKSGVDIGEGYITKPAELEILGKGIDEDISINKIDKSDNSEFFVDREFEFKDGIGSQILVTISEGKFHQVKRMFKSVGKEVLYLKRVEMGKLKLDSDLLLGEYRELTQDEISLLEVK